MIMHTYSYSLFKGLPPGGEKRVAAYASETKKLYLDG